VKKYYSIGDYLLSIGKGMKQNLNGEFLIPKVLEKPIIMGIVSIKAIEFNAHLNKYKFSKIKRSGDSPLHIALKSIAFSDIEVDNGLEYEIKYYGITWDVIIFENGVPILLAECGNVVLNRDFWLTALYDKNIKEIRWYRYDMIKFYPDYISGKYIQYAIKDRDKFIRFYNKREEMKLMMVYKEMNR